MDEIVADGMPPVHIVPDGAVWIMLIKKVVLAIPRDNAVRIIHPIRWWEEVIARPVRVYGKQLAHTPCVFDK